MKLSACIIAKNEEAMLPRCLESINGVDEIILVDTGSTDRTMDIAKKYGAKVYEHPWQNDFSLHRNQSISYANGDWIMIIDCDEQCRSDMSIFKERLDRIPDHVNGLVVKLYEISNRKRTTSWLGIRFFRRSSGVKYKNAVHNKASYEGGCAATDVVFYHYGYSLGKTKMAKKRKRTEKLLQARLDKDPEDHAALYYMTQMRIGQKKYDDAEQYGIKFFKCVPVGPNNFQFYSVMYFYMAWIYLHREDGESAYAWCNKGLELYPDDLDLNYLMARIGYQSKRDDLLKKHGEIYFERLEDIRKKDMDGLPGKFQKNIDTSYWANRTIYTNDVAAERNMRMYMEAL